MEPLLVKIHQKLYLIWDSIPLFKIFTLHHCGFVSRKRLVASFCLQGFTSLNFQCHFYYMGKINGLIFEQITAVFPMLRKYTFKGWWPKHFSKEKQPLSLGNWWCWCELLGCMVLACLFVCLQGNLIDFFSHSHMRHRH